MVHLMPDADGLIQTELDTQRVAYFVANFDMDENVVITPQGGAGIQITLVPGSFVSIADKIGLSIQGGTVGAGHRNYVVLQWIAGHAQ